jgi:hypothetical protein
MFAGGNALQVDQLSELYRQGQRNFSNISRSAKETCKCLDPRLFLGKQRQFANSQKSRGS